MSFAGPLANFALGIISSFLFVVLLKYVYPEILLQIIKYPELIHSNLPPVVAMLKFSIFINFILMGFNLIPLPPLDGSRMVATYLKGETLRKYEEFARYTPMIFIGAIFLSSFTGISIFGFLLWPFMQFSEFTVQLMFRIF